MNYIHNHDDYATEPVRGLPATLPRGEFVLWQGAPAWRAFARQVFKTRIIASLLALGATTRIVLDLSTGTSLSVALGEAGVMLAFGAVGLSILYLLAWFVQKTTVYTITNKRIVMRIGVAIQKTFNVPFAALAGAALKHYPNGTGNLSAALKPGTSIAYMIMWPHVRPWKMAQTEPTLRAIPQAENVARLLTDAFTSYVETNEALERSSVKASASPEEALKTSKHASRPDPRETDPHYIPKPMVIMAASLAIVTVIAVGIAQYGGIGTSQRPADAAIAFSQDLLFADQADGSITIVDSSNGELVSVIAPGSDGLLRGTLRSLGGTRAASDIDLTAPFQLQMHADDGVYLADALTGRLIRLESFGPLSTGAAADLMNLANAGAATAAQ